MGRQKGAVAQFRKSEIMTIRLDPRLRFAVELAARYQRRSASSFVEWCLLEILDQVPASAKTTVKQALEATWDIHEADRIVNLGLHYPELLSMDEMMLWKLIKTDGALWTDEIKPESLDRETLRKKWPQIVKHATKELNREVTASFKIQMEALSKKK